MAWWIDEKKLICCFLAPRNEWKKLQLIPMKENGGNHMEVVPMRAMNHRNHFS